MLKIRGFRVKNMFGLYFSRALYSKCDVKIESFELIPKFLEIYPASAFRLVKMIVLTRNVLEARFPRS